MSSELDSTTAGDAAIPAPALASDADRHVIEALRAGDEAAFSELVDRYGGSLQRLAFVYLKDRHVAEEVVQETWIGLLQSIHRFQGRSSLKTWLFRILMNCARTRARKESRSVSFSSLGASFPQVGDASVDPERFHRPGDQAPGAWAVPPGKWPQTPEASALSSETRACIDDAIGALSGSQREVITLRDIEGLSAEEVCNLLQISDTNQRVLLHRARAKVRSALDAYFEGGS